ncbi:MULTISPECIES: putative lipid II flippase FtsW [Halanaerobium]|uniref:Probable peptidoglycan glycosyltransferase FtsW n=1 Tax=Halanaerobium kushneri TaxID=56779 RepID=A0A1N6XDF0_9FIRM|nr:MULTISPECIES: putative lipid II flippase FtsW [Halanaerobium]RCW62064.1 cell division protein FtsW [Halanaerobium sp. ST460_2HS_T2]SIR00376.1 cell division protein FtsW [Halanaerobium kushneri]
MRKKLPDLILLFTILALVLSGLIMILSASSVKAEQLFSNSYYFFINQLKYLVVALVLSIIIYNLKYKKLKELAPYFLLLSLGTLILVLIPGIGKIAGGSRRWLPLGPISFQPSELAKFTIVLYLAAYIDKNKDKMKNFKKGILPPLLVIALISFLILLEPDLGTAVTLAMVAAVMIFIGGIRISVFIFLGLISFLLSLGAIITEPYRRERLLTFLNPWLDPLDSGYHIIQSLLALGSGGLFGVGAGNSHQKFLYLPEPGTDFIFAVLGEEFGLLGTLFIISLYFLLAWRGLKIAAKVDDVFGSMLAVGITSMIVIQALINMAVVTSLMPVTGITLPLISYGGSSLVINLVALSLLLNISCYVEG